MWTERSLLPTFMLTPSTVRLFRNFLYGFASAQSRVRYAPGSHDAAPPGMTNIGGGIERGGGMGMTSIGDAREVAAASAAAMAFGDGGRPY